MAPDNLMSGPLPRDGGHASLGSNIWSTRMFVFIALMGYQGHVIQQDLGEMRRSWMDLKEVPMEKDGKG